MAMTLNERIARLIQRNYGFVDWEAETPDGIARARKTAKTVIKMVRHADTKGEAK